MLRGDRFRSRMPHAFWLTLIVLALLLFPRAGLTGSSSSHNPQSSRLPDQEVQTNNATTKKFSPSPSNDIAKFADAEMHIVGVEMAKNGLGKDKGRVDVEVRPTAKPVVLVLTSYYSVDWHIKLAEGARIKRAIVSGYFEQEVQGLPADVPIVNRSYFPNDGSRRKEGWFWAHQPNTPQWREVVRRLNDMTGLPVASFQAKYQGDSVVVDGILGRDLGQDGLKPRAPDLKEPTPQELRAASANSELHVVGIYSPDMSNPGKRVDVEVRSTARPVVLVLTSYMETVWNIKRGEGARYQSGCCWQSDAPRGRRHSRRRPGESLLPRAVILLFRAECIPAREGDFLCV